MEALWSLEEKWKLSALEAVLLLVCSAIAVIGLCATTTIVKKKKKKNWVQSKQLVDEEVTSTNWCHHPSSGGGSSVKKVLMDYVRWSDGSKWEERESEGRPQTAPPLLGGGGGCGRGDWSHNSSSPVWQRPILMGEKCELPRFSGLILYDERGHPLHHHANQEKTETVATTLRDLL